MILTKQINHVDQWTSR